MLGLLLTMLIALGLSGAAIAAETVDGGDFYRLPAGEVLSDDLYISAGEIYIDGTIDGDLIAAGGYIEISGEVTGDVNATGGGINISGAVHDDARLAGGSISVSGSIGDDLFVAGGGQFPGSFQLPLSSGARNMSQGINLAQNGTVAGDAYLVGGQGTLAGSIVGDLVVRMNNFRLSGAVGGDANIEANSLAVEDSARIGGDFSYSTGQELAISGDVAGRTVYDDPGAITVDSQANAAVDFLSWLLRTVMVLLGLILVAWVLSYLAPQSLSRPAAALAARPAAAAIYGIVLVALAIPLTAALVFVAVLFWGWFPGGISMLTFGFGLLSLAWIFSPLITGYWLGHMLAEATNRSLRGLPATILGIVLIVLTARLVGLVPCAGELLLRLIYLMSSALSAGALLLYWRDGDEGDYEAE
jgi:cytoskeletal protein CcmA (bactofilin family)